MRLALLAVVVAAGCGRVGFEDEVHAPAFAIRNVAPAWATPAGGPSVIEVDGDALAATVAIDGLPCDMTGADVNHIECLAPPHPPGVVGLTALAIDGTAAGYALGFAYVALGPIQLGGSLDDRSAGIAIDGAGDIYVAGGTTSALGGPATGDFDAVLAKYDAAGTLLWVRQLGTPAFDYARDVAVAADGTVTIAGYTTGDLAAPTAGGNDIFSLATHRTATCAG